MLIHGFGQIAVARVAALRMTAATTGEPSDDRPLRAHVVPMANPQIALLVCRCVPLDCSPIFSLRRMTSLTSLIPDVDVLLGLAPEELASTVLQLVKLRLQNGKAHISHFQSDFQDSYGHPCPYPTHQREEAALAFAEAWNWLCLQGLLVPGMDSNGWVRLSRRASHLLDEGAFKTYVGSLAFPRSMLHPSIAEEVWLDVVRGDPGTAVFKAFRAVEIAVRAAGGYPDAEVGTGLMRKAFDAKNGPLADMNQPEAEREARAHLFAGAIGSFKNPHSHRTVTIDDVRAAQQQVMLASQLLSIVDVRKK